jgi:hypothetical protein
MDEEAFSRNKMRDTRQLFLYNRRDKIYYVNIFGNAFHASLWFSSQRTLFTKRNIKQRSFEPHANKFGLQEESGYVQS